MKFFNDIKLTVKAPLVIVALVLMTAAMMYFFGHSIAVLGGVAIACAASFLIVRHITKPLNAVNEAMTRVAGQDYSVAINDVSCRKDEIGEVAKSLEQFRDKLASSGAEMGKARSVIAALDRSQAVIEFTLDGNIVSANENFLKTVGYSLNEIVGKHHSIFVDPKESGGPAYRAFWDKLGRGEFDAGKYKRVTKSGDEIWISASYNPIFDENGKAIKVMKFCSDITKAEIETNENRSKLDALKLLSSSRWTAKSSPPMKTFSTRWDTGWMRSSASIIASSSIRET
ncbi:PAS domain S-box protein [Hyphococcus sp.]|uniref:PAS domain-containing protein n=1 Tax=Hyphococcus sp. TaxID=2038636 RepID=UPI003D0CF47A